MKDQLYAIVSPDKIDILTKLIEAYDHLAVVSTLDRSRGLVIIRVTEDNPSRLRYWLNIRSKVRRRIKRGYY